jgi:hypothetical protein
VTGATVSRRFVVVVVLVAVLLVNVLYELLPQELAGVEIHGVATDMSWANEHAGSTPATRTILFLLKTPYGESIADLEARGNLLVLGNDRLL